MTTPTAICAATRTQNKPGLSRRLAATAPPRQATSPVRTEFAASTSANSARKSRKAVSNAVLAIVVGPGPEVFANSRRSIAASNAEASSASVEDLAQPGFPAMATLAVSPEVGILEILSASTTRCLPRHAARRRRPARQLDELVELAAIEPHTPAIGAVVDLEPLPFGHQQRRVGTSWALHASRPQNRTEPRWREPPSRCDLATMPEPEPSWPSVT